MMMVGCLPRAIDNRPYVNPANGRLPQPPSTSAIGGIFVGATMSRPWQKVDVVFVIRREEIIST